MSKESYTSKDIQIQDLLKEIKLAHEAINKMVGISSNQGTHLRLDERINQIAESKSSGSLVKEVHHAVRAYVSENIPDVKAVVEKAVTEICNRRAQQCIESARTIIDEKDLEFRQMIRTEVGQRLHREVPSEMIRRIVIEVMKERAPQEVQMAVKEEMTRLTKAEIKGMVRQHLNEVLGS